MVLESLVPALDAHIGGKTLPEHIRGIDAEGHRAIKLIDAAPIGINVRSRLPPTRAYTTSCEGSRSLPVQRSAAIRRAIFL